MHSGAPRLQPGPRLRAGAVPYLNAKPLTSGLAASTVLDLREEAPSLLAAELAEGRLDLALLPAFAVLARPGLKAADGIAIGSDGPVRSVLLYSRRPLASLRTLAPDPASMSSNALVRILLAEIHGVRPAPAAPQEAEAVLVIGDAAMKPRPGNWEAVLDLGEAWRSLTGLPFVYALWAGPALDAATGEILRTAAHKGLEDRPGIARREAAALGLDEAETLTYLTRHIRYELGGRQHAGLRTYAGLLRSHGLLESALEPAWV